MRPRPTLRNRFWKVSLIFVAGSLLFFFLVLTTVVTPPMAERLVRLDEERRLLLLAVKGLDLPEGVVVRPSLEVEVGDIAVPLDDGRALVSQRRPGLWEAVRVVRPAPERVLLGLLLWGGLLYLLSALLARYVSGPLKLLAGGVRRYGEGGRDIRVEVPREAELAELAHVFNDMAARLAEREAQLERALEEKQRMFASTSHELRTPLTVILGYCQMLEDGMKGELTPEQGDVVEVIHRNARGLLEQVELLLSYSRLKGGTLPLELEKVDLGDLVEQVVDELRPLAAEAKLTLEVSLEEEAWVEIDHRQGRQILQNLVVNALKFTTRGGVKVRLLAGEGRAQVRVEDTGPGVAPAFEASLFEEFTRGPNSRGVGGTGLGLALSRRLAERMAGEVRLVANGPEGAVFSWFQPICGS